MYKSFGEQLVTRGETVLRFDYEGDGDSEGEVTDTNLEQCINDIQDAIDFLRRETAAETISLFGIRLGASLALLTAARTSIAQVLVWDPVVDGDAYLRELLRHNLTTQLATYGKVSEDRETLLQKSRNGDVINLFGYELGPDLVESVLKLDLIQLSNLSCPVSLVGFTLSDKQVLSPALQALQSRLGARFAVEKIRPFWHEPRLYQPFQKQLVAASMELIPLEGSLERESR